MSEPLSILSRRSVLKTVSSGFGYVAFAGLSSFASAADALARKLAAGAQAAALSGEGQAGDLPVHARGAVARRHVRLQAEARWPTPANRRRWAGWPARSCWARPGHSNSTARAGSGFRSLFPEVASHADELCVIRSMHTDLPAHPQAYLMMHTGHSQFVRPSLGAWTLYGLGTENENLPGFIAIKPVARNGGPQNYGSAFLPAIYQGTRIGNEATPVSSAELGNIKNPRLDRCSAADAA